MRYGTRHCFRRAPPTLPERVLTDTNRETRKQRLPIMYRATFLRNGEKLSVDNQKNNRNLTLRLQTIRCSTNERPTRPESRPLTVSPLLWKLPVGRGFKTSRLLPRARPFGSFRLFSAIIDGTPTIQLMQIRSRVAAVSISPKMVCTRFYLVPVQIYVSSYTHVVQTRIWLNFAEISCLKLKWNVVGFRNCTIGESIYVYISSRMPMSVNLLLDTEYTRHEEMAVLLSNDEKSNCNLLLELTVLRKVKHIYKFFDVLEYFDQFFSHHFWIVDCCW